MSDVLSEKQRSYCMSKIKGKNTKPELMLRKALWTKGIRYRVNNKLPGKPDIVFHRRKIAIFVDGCFWHCCPIHGSLPKNNAEFWKEKLDRNIRRDSEVNQKLKNIGWLVVRFWEHEVRSDLRRVVYEIEKIL